jgi:two-component system, OmpR family, phosphate regulon response regulator PhoB
MSRILIVDDHADIRRLIRMTLEFAGYRGEVEEAADGAAGLLLARSFCPDLVLTDLMMPGSPDGLGLCRELKADPVTRGAAVVMITARASAADRLAGIDAGARAYLVKPFSPLELIRTLEDLGVAA